MLPSHSLPCPSLQAITVVTLSLLSFSAAFPLDTDIVDMSQDSLLLPALHSRLRREAPTDPVEVAAHMANPRHRRPYGYVRPVRVVGRYYNPLPRVYVRIPRYNNYYRKPNSELFEMDPVSGGYLGNLLPIFKNKTPVTKEDPVPVDQIPIPAEPSSKDPLSVMTRQAPSWVWPDMVVSGPVPHLPLVRPGGVPFEPQSRNLKSVQAEEPILLSGP